MQNRRNFLKVTATGLVAATLNNSSFANNLRPVIAQSKPTMGQKRPIRIGAASMYFSDKDPEAWAKNAREMQYRAVDAPEVSINDTARIKAILAAVKRHDLMIAQVGRWMNLMDADPEKRKANLALTTEGLALADELNAKCCINIAGTLNTEKWDGPHPNNLSEDTFDLAVENARKIIDAVNPKRAVLCYEMMGWAIPDTPECCLKLIRAIDRKGYGVHLDIYNMITSPDKFWNNTSLINKTFDMLGQWIVGAHAKDVRYNITTNTHIVECPSGEGVFDHATMLNRLATLPQEVSLLIEHMRSQEDYLKCRDYLFKVAAETGVSVSG
jgi:Xylose isomerase-like TIM barrel.